MKTQSRFFTLLFLILILGMGCTSCSKDETIPPPDIVQDGDQDGVADQDDTCPTEAGPSSNNGCPIVIAVDNSDKINTIVANLNYASEVLLNVQDTDGGPKKREELSNEESSSVSMGQETSCSTKEYSLATNFEDVAILRPLDGIVWPGALVIGNGGMLDGLPDPLTLKRAPVTLSIDLPGIGENGTIVVDNPSNSSIKTGIDNALEYWNDNAYQEGYVNASNSSNQTTTSYSSKQMSLDVGLNVEWATGDASAQFDYSSTEEKRVAMMVYKQVFYTITMDTPANPAAVFAADIALSEVESKLTSETPPAYVQTVSYGRIIMFRMETTAKSTNAELEGALNYAAGVSVSATLEAKYKEILAESSVTTVTIGGNAAVASEAVSARNFGDLEPIIKGENAVYSRDNPGFPIAYTIRYLKDNSLAKMGYTTEYTAKDCLSQLVQNKRINYKNAARVWKGNTKTSDWWPGWGRVFLQYKKPNSNTIVETAWSDGVPVNEIIELHVPAGAHDIRVFQEYYYNCIGCSPFFKDRSSVILGTTPEENFVESWYDDNSATMKIYKTD